MRRNEYRRQESRESSGRGQTRRKVRSEAGVDSVEICRSSSVSRRRSAGTNRSGASQTQLTWVIQQDDECDSVNDLMASPIPPSKAARAVDPSTKTGCPKAKIVLTHNAPHTLNCSAACLKHLHFLIRVLPTGRVTPVEELPMPALANMARRQEEQFCVKTFADFEHLHAALRQTKETAVSTRPTLPQGCLQCKSVWGRMTTGVEHNPKLVEELQTYLDTIMCQLPLHGTKSDPALASFFATDRLDVTHPLVQAAMPACC